MRWTGRFLIVLTLLSLGCARGDSLVDVTGTWERPFRSTPFGGERTTRWVLRQKGAKVTGEVPGPNGAPLGSVEGLVNGEVFDWRATATFWPGGLNRPHRGNVTVSSDELSGRADGSGCPCTFVLRRVSTDTIKEKKAE